MDRILEYIAKFLALLLVLPIHEFAHAFVAVKSGDITPKLYNRYTLNPLAHFDPLGLICFVLAGFGWAKPVPVNPNNFNNYKKGCFWVSIAGVSANYITAFLFYPLYILSFMFLPNFGFFDEVISLALLFIFSFSLSFCVFNLLPVYPLDGFRVLDAVTKTRGKVYWFLKTKGTYVLYTLFALSLFADITGFYQIDILGNFLSMVVGFIGRPITLFWDKLIFQFFI